MSVFTDHFRKGTHAARPAANAAGLPIGAKYSCSDHNLVYETDGSVWSTWYDPSNVGTVLTTKGDLVARSSSAPARLAVGANGTSLVADSAQTLGVKYENRVKSIVAGANVTVDSTDPLNPVVASTGGGGGSSTGWVANVNNPLSSMAALATPASGTWAIVSGVLNSSAAAVSEVAYGTDTQEATGPTLRGVNSCEVEMRPNTLLGGTQRMGFYVAGPSTGSSTGYALAYFAVSGSTWTLCEERSGSVLVYTSATLAGGNLPVLGSWIRLSILTTHNYLKIYINGVLYVSMDVTLMGTLGSKIRLFSMGMNVDFRNLKTWDSILNPPSPF
jgi:hypothetical protein